MGSNTLLSVRNSVVLVAILTGGCGESTTSNASNWRINTNVRSTEILEEGGGQGVLYDVQVAERRTVDSTDYIYVETTGIPQYDVIASQELVDELNARPNAATDFVGGTTSLSVGEPVVFGQDIGFRSSTRNCDSTGGSGYWPPGPECPLNLERTELFPASPEPNVAACETGLGTVGMMVNGAAIFNWGDGMSFGNGGVWFNLAPIAEQYDVDICAGHAANGEYHHHMYTRCLAELVNDEGTSHSPVYGYSADGYPVHGPYESAGTLAVSGWARRDYGASPAAGGCGTPGERTCTLNDEYDLTQGVDTTVAQGPDIDEVVTTASGNVLPAAAGYYYQDYYYAGAPVTGPQLDEHNGHDAGDGLGYHYHITMEENGETLTPRFPFTIGPRFRGELPDVGVARCSTGTGGPPPGGGGAPP